MPGEAAAPCKLFPLGQGAERCGSAVGRTVIKVQCKFFLLFIYLIIYLKQTFPIAYGIKKKKLLLFFFSFSPLRQDALCRQPSSHALCLEEGFSLPLAAHRARRRARSFALCSPTTPGALARYEAGLRAVRGAGAAPGAGRCLSRAGTPGTAQHPAVFTYDSGPGEGCKDFAR